jgi:hypothetical protein
VYVATNFIVIYSQTEYLKTMNRYTYETPVGTFLIRPIAKKTYGLLLNDTLLGSYLSAAEAADDVYRHRSGWSEWDDLRGDQTAPAELSGWALKQNV